MNNNTAYDYQDNYYLCQDKMSGKALTVMKGWYREFIRVFQNLEGGQPGPR